MRQQRWKKRELLQLTTTTATADDDAVRTPSGYKVVSPFLLHPSEVGYTYVGVFCTLPPEKTSPLGGCGSAAAARPRDTTYAKKKGRLTPVVSQQIDGKKESRRDFPGGGGGGGGGGGPEGGGRGKGGCSSLLQWPKGGEKREGEGGGMEEENPGGGFTNEKN